MRERITSHRYASVREQLAAAPRTWLVTGAAGFIGSNLVQGLLELGQRVVGLDNFSTGHAANLDEATRAGVGSFRFVEGDVRDPAACRDASAGVDYVLHHAALASVPASVADPVTSAQVNVEGTLNVFIAARDAGVSRVVYASTSAVYGDTPAVAQVEGTTGQMLSPYAASKAANELYASVFQRAYGLSSIGLRYFNIYGPRQDPNGAYAAVIPRWIGNLIDGIPCEIYGDGETTRDFCSVSDVVQANVLAATAPSAAAGSVYNIAGGVGISLNTLYGLLRDFHDRDHGVDGSVTPTYLPARTGDIRQSVADISRARSTLEFVPSVPVARGLDTTLAWYAARTNGTTTS
jgi:UDP-N-acetylglucosamine 4-epimerase